MGLADETYILLTTFRKDGSPVATPVWIAPLGGDQYGFYTSGGTGKTKRLAHTSRVTVQGCNATGKKTHGPVYEGTARVVQGPERDEVHAKIVAKYGFLTRIAQLLGTLTFKLQRKNLSYADSAVVLTVPDAAS